MVYAQFSSACVSVATTMLDCGGEACGSGFYAEDNNTGQGINDIAPRGSTCIGTTCGDVLGVPRSTVTSQICCNRDQDAFFANNPGCPTTTEPDCNDNNPAIGYPCPPTPTPTPSGPSCPGAQIKPQSFQYCPSPWTEDTVNLSY